MATKDTKLRIIVDAQNKAGGALRGVNSDLASVQQRMQKIGVIGSVAFAGLSSAVFTSVKAFQAQERAESRLEAIATKVTGATEEQIQSFKDLAREMQKVGVVGDEVLISGQSQLASFTKSHKVVTELSDDLADLAVATYGVDVSQEQAIQTANNLGRALSGQLGALTRTGILVSDEFEDAFKSANNEQERAVILSKIIQDNYGGLNKAMRKTSEGGLQALKNSFGDLQEEIGQIFIPKLNTLIEKILPVVDKIGQWTKKNPELVNTIIMVTAGITGLMAVMLPLSFVLPALVTTFTLLSGPIGLIVAALGAMALAFALIYPYIKDTAIWDGFKSILSEMKTLFFELVTMFQEYIVPLLQQIWMLLQPFLPILASIASFIAGVMKDTIIDHIKLLTLIVKEVNNVLATLKGWYKFMTTAFVQAWGIVDDVVIGVVSSIIDAVEAMVNFIIDSINVVIDKINNLIDQLASIPKIGGAFKGMKIERMENVDWSQTGQTNAPAGASELSRVLNINVSGNTLLDENAGEAVGDMIMKKLQLSSQL